MRVFIGHRGSGKTEFSKRWAKSKPETKLYDLDAEIEKHARCTTKEFIEREGIRPFRKLEVEIFNQLYAEHGKDPHACVVLGAGFEGQLPEDVERLWIRREIDARGRVFLNRPRLGKNLRSSQDYLDLYPQRLKRFRSQSQGCELTLREGHWGESAAENKYFSGKIHLKNRVLTLKPEHFENPKFESWVQERLGWGITFEFRTDLLSEKQWQRLYELCPQDMILLSIRRKKISSDQESQAFWIDADIDELSDLSKTLRPKILSAHVRKEGENLEDFLARLELKGRGLMLKAAPEIFSWEELRIGYEWEMARPNMRVFLPRTPDSQLRQGPRYKWYRLLRSPFQRMSFVREGEGSHPDQPTLFDMLSLPETFTHFAAVIGEDVVGSYSPSFHESFFAKHSMPFVAVSVPRSEAFPGVMKFLEDLGLKAAALTSPYKKDAYAFAQQKDMPSFPLTNTLVKDKNGLWRGTLTDQVGVTSLLADLKKEARVAIWGSGAMSELLRKVYPKASVYSARSGQKLEGPGGDVDYLFWAGSNTTLWPDFKPGLVVDLNYTSYSQGMDFAVSQKVPYRSGLEMFKGQALAQQKYWSMHLT